MSKIKELWNKISDFISPYLKTYKIFKFLTSKTFLFLIVLVLAILIGRSCAKTRDYQRIVNIRDQNIMALTDTIKKERTKSNRQSATIAGYITTIKDLEAFNRDLYKEVMDQEGNVLSLNNVIFQLRQDSSKLRSHVNYLESVINQPIRLNDSTFKLTWAKRYDWDSINYDIYKGQSFVGLSVRSGYTWKDAFDNKFGIIDMRHYDTEIIDRISQVEITLGQKIEDKQLRIFVQTDYPGFTATSLSGILIDPNTNKDIQDLLIKKRWFPNTFSVGVGPSFGYNIFSNKIYLGIGVNVSYNLLQW